MHTAPWLGGSVALCPPAALYHSKQTSCEKMCCSPRRILECCTDVYTLYHLPSDWKCADERASRRNNTHWQNVLLLRFLVFFFFCDQIRLVALQSFRKYYLCVRFCCCCSCCTKIDHEICRLTNLINYTDNNRDILLTASIILYYWQWSVTRWWWTDQWPNHLYMNDERMDTVSQCVWGERLFNCVVNKNGQMHCQRTNIINVCHKTVIIILLLYYFKFLFAVCSQYMDILPWKLNDWTIVLAFVCWLFRPNPCRHSERNLSTLQFSTCWRNLIICKFKLKCTSKCDFPFNSIAGACRICVCVCYLM